MAFAYAEYADLKSPHLFEYSYMMKEIARSMLNKVQEVNYNSPQMDRELWDVLKHVYVCASYLKEVFSKTSQEGVHITQLIRFEKGFSQLLFEVKQTSNMNPQADREHLRNVIIPLRIIITENLLDVLEDWCRDCLKYDQKQYDFSDLPKATDLHMPNPTLPPECPCLVGTPTLQSQFPNKKELSPQDDYTKMSRPRNLVGNQLFQVITPKHTPSQSRIPRLSSFSSPPINQLPDTPQSIGSPVLREYLPGTPRQRFLPHAAGLPELFGDVRPSRLPTRQVTPITLGMKGKQEFDAHLVGYSMPAGMGKPLPSPQEAWHAFTEQMINIINGIFDVLTLERNTSLRSFPMLSDALNKLTVHKLEEIIIIYESEMGDAPGQVPKMIRELKRFIRLHVPGAKGYQNLIDITNEVKHQLKEIRRFIYRWSLVRDVPQQLYNFHTKKSALNYKDPRY